jgi:hypothetical protein
MEYSIAHLINYDALLWSLELDLEKVYFRALEGFIQDVPVSPIISYYINFYIGCR